MKFCSECSAPVEFKKVFGEDRPRFVCSECEKIHYVNPRMISGCLIVHDRQILLCRRSIEPCKGAWTLPAGYLENGETVEAGAIRETWEESRAEVEIEHLHTLYSIPKISMAFLIFKAHFKSKVHFEPTPESSEVKLFNKDEIPWDTIAFSSISFCLKQFIEKPDSLNTHIGHFKGPKLPPEYTEGL